MYKEHDFLRLSLLRGYKCLCVILYALLFHFFSSAFYLEHFLIRYGWFGALTISVFYGILMTFLIGVYKGFSIGILRVSEIVYSQSLALLFGDATMYVLFFFLSKRLLSLIPLLSLFIAQEIIAVCWSMIGQRIHRHFLHAQSTAVFYRDDRDLEMIQSIPFFSTKFEIIETLRITQDFSQIEALISRVSNVFIAGADMMTRNRILKLCLRNGVQAYVAPRLGDVIMEGARVYHLQGQLFMNVRRMVLPFEYRIVKRAFDVVVSLTALVALSPLMLIVALAIVLCDHGPVFYRQKRLTQNGREFNILKFRSMFVDAEKDGIARVATVHDNRITPVGRIIRACRLDELPQLWNILRGDMSIVGPRPERPEIALEYEKELPEFALRLQVKAGLTGYAQVYGRYNSEPYEKLQMDLMYINSMSVIMDLKMMLATVKILFMKESTEGFEVEEVTTGEAGETGKSA